MEKRKMHEPAATPPTQRVPRSYRTPTLTAYGSVAKLTQSIPGSLAEGESGMPHKI